MHTCIEVIYLCTKLVVIRHRAVLQVHSDIFSMGSAISEAYLNLTVLLCQFQETQTLQILHISFA